MTEPIYILRGIAGSTAHGLATAESDEDLHGVFTWPTEAFWKLRNPAESMVGTDPDFAYHELVKFLRLAAHGNPTIMEVLWLESYVEMEPEWGYSLIGHRTKLLSAHAVMMSYIGYAESQFRKVVARDGQSFSSDVRKRTNKHARHMLRLMEQGKHLYEAGELVVKVSDRQRYLDYKDMSIEQLTNEFARLHNDFTEAKTILPEKPDWAAIDDFLRLYRKAH